jgi:hypothetical protein
VRRASHHSYYFKFALAAALLVVVAVVRLPFISNILASEEGDFAVLVLSDVPLSAQSDTHLPRDFIGYIEGKPVLSSFHRTVMPYIVLEKLGRLFAPRHTLGRLPPEQLSAAARLPFAIIFLLGCAGLVAIAVEAAAPADRSLAVAASIAPLSVALWVLTTPLAVGASIYPQIDGSVGILLLGTAATLLAAGNIEQTAARWRFIAAGLLAGLGKHEWALAFAAAALCTVLAALLFSSVRRATLRACAAFLAGLALAVALSYAIAPDDYRQGFRVMADFYSMTGGQLWAIAPAQWPFTLPVLALILADGVFIVLVLRPLLRSAPGPLLAYLGGTAITAGYVISGWAGEGFPRYYAPPLIILGVVFVSLWLRFRNAIAPAAGWAVAAATVIGLGANYLYLSGIYDSKVSLTEMRGTPLSELAENYATAAKLARDSHGIVFAYTPTWIYYPGTSFISAGLGKQYAEDHMMAFFPQLKDRLVFPPDRMVEPYMPR